VVDYGCWYRGERSAIRRLANAEGASFRMVYLPVDEEPRRARIAHRWATTPEATLPMTEADILDGRAHVEEPDAAELAAPADGESHVYGEGDRVTPPPTMIGHDIEAHGHVPPEELARAARAVGRPRWDPDGGVAVDRRSRGASGPARLSRPTTKPPPRGQWGLRYRNSVFRFEAVGATVRA
jgi:hypothetical protein